MTVDRTLSTIFESGYKIKELESQILEMASFSEILYSKSNIEVN
jgi:hypothetical protein